MSERINLEAGALADLIGSYRQSVDSPAANELTELLNGMRSSVLSGNSAEKKYWIDIYRRRQETAAALKTGLADGLAKVVQELTNAESDYLVLFIVNAPVYGYFIWLNAGLSSVISCFKVRDRRS